jgi:hypothetical protein
LKEDYPNAVENIAIKLGEHGRIVEGAQLATIEADPDLSPRPSSIGESASPLLLVM